MATRNVPQSNPRSKLSAAIIRRLRAYRFRQARSQSHRVIPFPLLVEVFRRRGIAISGGR